MRRSAWIAVVAAAALMVTACSGLPTTGPVNPGLAIDDVDTIPDFSFLPDGPQPGATQEQIVQGFVAAATSPANNWDIARQFLDPATRDDWKPETAVYIDAPGDRSLTVVDDDTVLLELTVRADVDVAGAYHVSEAGPSTLPPYELVQVDGEWRINKAPDGIVLDADNFDDVFRPYALMYFDPTWTYLVPDVRWFPARTNTATRIAQALVDGTPSPWLAASVATAFPDDVALARQAVPTLEGVAQVELQGTVQTDAVTLSRMQRQLESSLQLPGINGVDMLVGTSVIDTPAATVRSTAIDSRPLVRTADGFGFLSAAELTPIAGLSDAIVALPAVSIAAGRGLGVAAARLDDGTVVRVNDVGELLVVDERGGLVDPAIDIYDYVWSVPRGIPGAVQAVGADGVVHDVTGAWPEATSISSMQMSRDGTRVAATITLGGVEWAVVAGVVRDTDGVPVSIGEPLRLAQIDGLGTDVAWLDDQTLGVITAAAGETRPWEQTVGGLGAVGASPTLATTIAAGASVTSPLLLGADGVLFVRRGATWQQSATDILVLASQLGQG